MEFLWFAVVDQIIASIGGGDGLEEEVRRTRGEKFILAVVSCGGSGDLHGLGFKTGQTGTKKPRVEQPEGFLQEIR